MEIERRVFLQRTAACAAALTGSLRSLGADKNTAPPPIVDTHQHLWDLQIFSLPWVKSSPELNRSFLNSDYRQATRGLNVAKAVYMEVAVVAEQQLAEALHVVELCARGDTPTCAAVIGGRPAAEDFRAYIMRFKDSRYVKGVRAPFRAVTDRLVRNVRLLGELDKSFDLNVPPNRLGEGLRLVERCPGTRFIVDHCGNADPKAFASGTKREASHDPDPWRRGMAALAARRNVACKISGVVARARKATWKPADLAPIINHCLEVFGPNRVMFGSDWPVCTRVASYRQWVGALREVVGGRPRAARRKLFHDNALRWYRLG